MLPWNEPPVGKIERRLIIRISSFGFPIHLSIIPRMPRPRLSHLDDSGKAKMVDVGAKPVTQRTALAEGFISLQRSTIEAIAGNKVPKGEVLSTARLAGIMAAKRTGELIPLCHPLAIDCVEVDFDLPDLSPSGNNVVSLRVKAMAGISAKTGVEMEALTAVAVAALTVYDMCKAIDKSMVISGIRLLSKTGGTRKNIVI
jgi:cyclic pyranopterin phosphate synthase